MFILQTFCCSTYVPFECADKRIRPNLTLNSLKGVTSGLLISSIILSVNNVAKQYPISTIFGSTFTIGSIPLALRGVVHLAHKTGVGVEKAEFVNKNISKYLDFTFIALQTIALGLFVLAEIKRDWLGGWIVVPLVILTSGLTIARIIEKHDHST